MAANYLKLCERCQLPLKQVDAKFKTHTWRDCIDYIDTTIEKLTGLRFLIVSNVTLYMEKYEPRIRG